MSNSSAVAFNELLASPPQPTMGTEAVDRILHAIRDHLGMDVAFVAEFRKSDRVFRHVDARDATPIQPGDAAPLEMGYCQRVVDGRLPELIPDTQRVPAAKALAETHSIPIGAHVSVPIRLSDGRLFGTFCCFSFSPDPSLSDRDLQVMKAFAALLGHQLDRDIEGQRDRSDKVKRIESALTQGQPSIVYQPIFDLRTRRLAGLESLSRFQMEPQRSPDRWYAEAVEAGLSAELEIAAIRSALPALSAMPPDTYLSVNCSPNTAQSGLLDQVLHATDIRRVVLEITEHDFIEDYPALLAALAPLRALGLRVAIDDAGAGYASLRHVLHIQPELIKLDISLTRNIDADPKRRALASALIAFARETQARLIAEGVETAAELRTLRNLGATCAQGYFLSRPLPLFDALAQPFPAPARETDEEALLDARSAR